MRKIAKYDYLALRMMMLRLIRMGMDDMDTCHVMAVGKEGNIAPMHDENRQHDDTCHDITGLSPVHR